MKQTVWFSEVGKKDVSIAGGKGANLGELTRAGLPVPPGFIVTADAYFNYIRKTGLAKKIDVLLKGINPEDSRKLQVASREIKHLIMETSLPANLKEEITDAYEMMGDDVVVAVRSSATAEDLPDASFAGQQATFLNVSGGSEVVRAVQRAYASLFEARAIYYRIINHYDHNKVALAVPIQQMIESEKSGIMFTVDPVTSDLTKIVIEAGWGLGEAIVSGSVTPDRYVVDKASNQIVNKEIHTQTWKIVKAGHEGDKHVLVPRGEQSVQKLSDEEILALAAIAKKIEAHYGSPQDTEWAVQGGNVYMVQSRPVTTLKEAKEAVQVTSPVPTTKISDDLILTKGAPASIGSASGPVKIIHKPSEIDKVVQGDVLVTEMTTPDYVPAMRRAAAIVTDTGGRTCHAAIVSRELGIPCVVGTGTATSSLKTGQIITVDGQNGIVYKGKVELNAQPTVVAPVVSGTSQNVEQVPVTGTKVYVNLGEPDLAAKVAALPSDGVGLMRAEFIIAGIGEHPRAMMKAGRGEQFTDALAEGIRTIASAFNPRPVVYRFTDFKTNEYRNLKGGSEFEPQENNPMIGYRGASRYVKEPDVFALELSAIKKVREGFDLKNLHVMIPFVRTIDEFIAIRKMIEEAGLKQSNDFKLWIMVEVPSAVILLEDFCQAGIDGISIGSNDLTQLTLGVDRDNQTLAGLFDERNEAVVASLEHICRIGRKYNVTVSCCGQAPSVYPEITEVLVRAGATSVSVSPDMVSATRKLVASVEQRLLLSSIPQDKDEAALDVIP